MNKSKIFQILSEVLNEDITTVKNFDPNTPLSNMNLTSLSMITFIVRIEDSFKFEIRDSDLLYENFSTLNRIFNTLAPYIEPQESSKKCLIFSFAMLK